MSTSCVLVLHAGQNLVDHARPLRDNQRRPAWLHDSMLQDRRRACLEIGVAAVEHRDRVRADRQGLDGEAGLAALKAGCSQGGRAVPEGDCARRRAAPRCLGLDRGRERHRLTVDGPRVRRRDVGRGRVWVDGLLQDQGRAGGVSGVAAVDGGDRLRTDGDRRGAERGLRVAKGRCPATSRPRRSSRSLSACRCRR